MRDRTKKQQGTFPASLENLKDIQAFIKESCRTTSLTPKQAKEVLLSAEEVCTNIIRHSYLYSSGNIEISVRSEREVFSIVISDQGRQFDPTQIDSSDLDTQVETGRKGGLGLQMVKKLMDQMEYKYESGKNQLKLSKRLSGPARPEKIKPRVLSERVKIISAAALLLAVLVSGYYYFSARKMTTAVTDGIFQSASELAATLAKSAAEPLFLGDDLTLSNLMANFSQGREELEYLIIIDTAKVIWATSGDPRSVLSRWNAPLGIRDDEAKPQLYRSENGEKIYHLAVPIQVPQEKIGTVLLGLKGSYLESALSRSRRALIQTCLLIFAIGLAGTYLLSHLALRPLKNIRRRVEGSVDLESIPLGGEKTKEETEILRFFNEAAAKIRRVQKVSSDQERLKRENELAEEIRQSLLPKEVPQLKEAGIASLYKVAREIGGDYFDYIWIDRDRLGLVIADIAGQGVSAALVMSAIRTALRLRAPLINDPVQVLEEVDSFVSSEIPKGMFVTMFYAILNLVNWELTCASAGHNPALLYRIQERKLLHLNPKGMPLGLKLEGASRLERQSLTVKLEKGDTLILYTDGITECVNVKGEQFGINRLAELVQAGAGRTPAQLIEKLEERLAVFSANANQRDDVTMVVIQRKASLNSNLKIEKLKSDPAEEIQGNQTGDSGGKSDTPDITLKEYKE